MFCILLDCPHQAFMDLPRKRRLWRMAGMGTCRPRNVLPTTPYPYYVAVLRCKRSLAELGFKIALAVWTFFLFLYFVGFRGAEWHANGAKNCCFCPEDPTVALFEMPKGCMGWLNFCCCEPLRMMASILSTACPCCCCCCKCCGPSKEESKARKKRRHGKKRRRGAGLWRVQ